VLQLLRNVLKIERILPSTNARMAQIVLRVARVPAGSPIRGKLWIDDFVLVEKSKVEGRS
jgi:hypothetical protein